MSDVDELERCPYCGEGIEIYARECPHCGRDVVEQKLEIFRGLRKRGSVTPGAFDAIEGILRETVPAPDAAASEDTGIRKQVDELTGADLASCPVWEFAIDEEGEEGRDEETVKPRPDLEQVDPRQGLFVVRTEFVARDGSRFVGYSSPATERDLRVQQPTIVAGQGQVAFWHGMVPPTSERLERAYRLLGKTPAELFPIEFGPLAGPGGEIPAFLSLSGELR